jgi:outer membrane protein assembly factor BamB
MPHAYRSLCLLLVFWSWLSPVHAQEWTRFRGPNGAGRSEAKSLPAVWTAADYHWKVELPGRGHSSPVLWGDRLFVLNADPENATRFVLCYSATGGQLLWRRDYASEPHHLHDRNTYASSTPAVDAQRVYVAWSTPKKITFLALDHQGQEVWNLDLGPWTSQHGFGTSPMLFEDLVILSNNQQAEELDAGQTPGESYLIAVEARTGKERWRTPRVSIRVCYSTPCIYQGPDGLPELVCTSTAEGVYSLDPRTGREKWRRADAFAMRVVSSPLVAEGLIFGSTGSGGGGNTLVAVRPYPRPEIVYTVKKTAPYVPCAVAQDGLLFLFYDRGIASCLDLATGAVHWQERLGDGFSGSPVIADGKVYCIADNGTVYVLAAAAQYQLLGQNPLGEPTRSTPAIAGGRLYFRTLSHLFSVGGKTGSAPATAR